MIGKLPKSEVSKQSDPDRPGLRLHLRYLRTDFLMKSIGFRQSFHARATWRAPNKLGGPPGSHNLATLPTGLRLASTLLNWSFASGMSEVGCVCCNWGYGGYL
jgi:hypothetical protein